MSGPALGYNGFYFDLWAKGVNEELCWRLVNCDSNKPLQASLTVMNYPVLLSLSASELTSVQMKIGEVTARDKIKIVSIVCI